MTLNLNVIKNANAEYKLQQEKKTKKKKLKNMSEKNIEYGERM